MDFDANDDDQNDSEMGAITGSGERLREQDESRGKSNGTDGKKSILKLKKTKTETERGRLNQADLITFQHGELNKSSIESSSNAPKQLFLWGVNC